jgi:tetratricopeptide (TPR) repeat protein
MARCIEIFDRAILIYPQDMMLNFDYAYHLGHIGHLEEAIRYYMRCLAIRPNQSGVWRKLGIALRQTDDLDGSISALRQSLTLQSDYAPTHVDLGWSLERLGKLDEAATAYREAIELTPDLGDAHGRLGHVLHLQGRHSEALDELRRCETLGPTHVTAAELSEWIVECEANIVGDEP